MRTGWRASRTSVLEVADFSSLGDLLGDVAAGGGAVSGPFWKLDPGNEVHAEARRLAAEDARRRADVYAEALGLRVTGISWVTEPGLRRTEPAQFTVAAAGMAGSASVNEDVIDVTPDEMTVDAAVEVGFQFGASGS